MKDRIISNFKIERKNRLNEELMRHGDSFNDLKENINNNNQKNENIIQQNPYENIAINEFKNNVKIQRNGKSVNKNNYYSDYNQDNRIYSQNIPVRESNEDVEQVDPNDFFGNSLKGVL